MFQHFPDWGYRLLIATMRAICERDERKSRIAMLTATCDMEAWRLKQPSPSRQQIAIFETCQGWGISLVVYKEFQKKFATDAQDDPFNGRYLG